MKTCFSEEKLIKHFGPSPFLREPPFSTNPLFLSNFFMTPLFVQILKIRSPPLILWGRKLWPSNHKMVMHAWKILQHLLQDFESEYGHFVDARYRVKYEE